MTTCMEGHIDGLMSALRAARQNAERWMEMSADFSVDGERMEQWTSTARLRRHEVERIEKLLAQMIEQRGSPQPAGRENTGSGSQQGARL